MKRVGMRVVFGLTTFFAFFLLSQTASADALNEQNIWSGEPDLDRRIEGLARQTFSYLQHLPSAVDEGVSLGDVSGNVDDCYIHYCGTTDPESVLQCIGGLSAIQRGLLNVCIYSATSGY